MSTVVCQQCGLELPLDFEQQAINAPVCQAQDCPLDLAFLDFEEDIVPLDFNREKGLEYELDFFDLIDDEEDEV